jgi:putative SOS response-associated peptidase YedK
VRWAAPTMAVGIGYILQSTGQNYSIVFHDSRDVVSRAHWRLFTCWYRDSSRSRMSNVRRAGMFSAGTFVGLVLSV